MNARFLLSAMAVVLSGCAGMGAGDAPRAAARLEPTRGNATAGTVEFVQVGDRVRVSAKVSGLKPGQEHGFHVHEAGDCSSGDGMSAKGHFNPYGKPHGPRGTTERHAGDVPNLRADASGNASATFDLDVMTVAPGPASVIGRGVIVHVQPDDYTSQPVGNAGARMACGVVRAV